MTAHNPRLKARLDYGAYWRAPWLPVRYLRGFPKIILIRIFLSENRNFGQVPYMSPKEHGTSNAKGLHITHHWDEMK